MNLRLRILVTGCSGFIGRRLGAELVKAGYQVIAPVRKRVDFAFPVEQIDWNSRQALRDIDGVIHLAGESIAARRWSAEQKKKILSSRVDTAKQIGEMLESAEGRRPTVLLSASGIGYYGNRGAEVLTEKSSLGQGFLAEVCEQWEESARALGIPRTVFMRTGMVLGRNGGALEKIRPLFQMGLGGKLGGGEQWMSWIHLDDIVALYLFALGNQVTRGPLNCVAPQPVTNEQFTRILAKVLGRPAFLPAPSFALKLALGEMSTLLLDSQRVQENASARGFSFRFSTLETALHEALA